MSNPNPKTDHLTPWQPGQSGNPKGLPKGTKHISTHIQEMLEDEGFTAFIKTDPKGKKIEYKGKPIKAIIGVASYRAMQGDKDAREWLAKYGYGSKQTIELKNPARDVLEAAGLMGGNNDRQTDEDSSRPPESKT